MTRDESELAQEPPTEPTAESPEKLPGTAWVTLVGFAAFVVLFGTCASAFMFR